MIRRHRGTCVPSLATVSISINTGHLCSVFTMLHINTGHLCSVLTMLHINTGTGVASASLHNPSTQGHLCSNSPAAHLAQMSRNYEKGQGLGTVKVGAG